MIQLPETRLQLNLLRCFTFSLFHCKNAEEWRPLGLHYFTWKLSRNCCKIAAREGWRSFFSALSSIWRIRSRVT